MVRAIVVIAALALGAEAAAMDITASRAQDGCIIERVTYRHDGYLLVGWVMRPEGEGPWPTVVWNHGSRVDAHGNDGSDRPTLSLDARCLPDVASGHRAYFWPEGRGYGGSEGPKLRDTFALYRQNRELGYQATARYLQGRAADTNAGVEALIARGIARRDALAVIGASHGGVVSLFAGATAGDLYRAVVIQATGLCYYNAECGADVLDDAAAKIGVPFLVQHAANDSLCPPEVSRRLAAKARARNADVRHVEYPGNLDQEGHAYFGPRNFSVWGRDVYDALARAFAPVDPRHASAPPMLAEPRGVLSALPANAAVMPPAPSLARWQSALSGRWHGFWDGELEHILVVERMDGDGVDVIYAYGQIGSRPPGASRERGVWEDGALRLDLRRPATVRYRLDVYGTVSATYEWQGGIARATLKRMD